MRLPVSRPRAEDPPAAAEGRGHASRPTRAAHARAPTEDAASRTSVLTAKNVKQLARPHRTRLQGGEYGTRTTQGGPDSERRRTRATGLVGASVSDGPASRAAGADHCRVG